MPNDIPDWTAQAKSNLVGGISGLNLGDVGAPSLAPDSVTETPSGALLGSGGGVMVSYKALTTFALVKAGAALVGTATGVNPLFGQATAAGNLLTARVTASASGAEPATNAAGWVKLKSVNTQGGWCAIWALANSLGNDAAPQFTGGGAGLSVMMAQLAEYSGGITVSPADQSGTGGQSGNTIVITNPATDVAFGDLIEVCTHYAMGGPGGGATFSDAFNNGATAVQDGSVNLDQNGNGRNSVFTHAIIPAATVAQPLGVADWAYDASGTSAPAVGSQAKVVLAATPGKTYTAALLSAALVNNSAAGANAPTAQLLDGATVIFQRLVSSTAVAGSQGDFDLAGLAIKGTAGNSMTWQVSVAVAANTESASIGAYLR